MNKPMIVGVNSRMYWNDTGITLEARRRYRLEAIGKWTDFFIKRDSNGFTSDEAPALLRGILRKHEPRRRVASENWFALIGTTDHDEAALFRIGTGGTIVPHTTGQLCCFANDEPGFYWNNWGSIELRVTLLE